MALLLPNAPYFAPTYFPPAYFSGGPGASSASGPSPYNAPTYFAPAYFSGPAADSSSPTAPVAGRSPYNAPTYFAPTYFYAGSGGSSSPTVPVLRPSPYNAPTYFAPAYFFGGAADPTAPLVVARAIPGRDGSSYVALATALDCLGTFAAVIFGEPTRRLAPGADAHPLAVITPKGWEEVDDTDPTLLLRRVLFTIRIIVLAPDDDAPFGELDRLAALAQAQVDRSDLGGGCVPALTRIRAGRYQPLSQYPEWSVELDGEFSLLIDPSAGLSAP